MKIKPSIFTSVNYNGRIYNILESQGLDLSIKNKFDNENPTFFHSNQSSIKIVQSENFVGDIYKGGSCNANIASVDIHCSGTHTECIAHISKVSEKIVDFCPKGFIPTQLITVDLKKIADTNETYYASTISDLVITKKSIKEKIEDKIDSLIIRTLPNSKDKLSQNYDKYPAPFLTTEAVEFINELSVLHLLVDIPSIDKANDNGVLGNHHSFFKKGKTVSELLYIDNSIKDSFGFLQIQIPNWNLDAAPSRPIFFPA
jgi:kynurenine formamidase